MIENISDKTKSMLRRLGLNQMKKDVFIHMWMRVLHDRLHQRSSIQEGITKKSIL